MAHTVITGNLGKEPKLRQTNDGKPWISLSIAWSERSKDSQGQWVDGPTVWVSVRVFGKQAANLAATVYKGMQVTAVGDLKPETWHSDQGEQTVFAMNATHVGVAMFHQVAQVAKAEPAQQGNSGWVAQDANGQAWNSQDAPF